MIYIGKREYKFRGMIMSHMIADSVEELKDFATLDLSIAKKHFQNKPERPHYDICKSKKKIALTYEDVLEVDDKKIIQICRKLYSKK